MQKDSKIFDDFSKLASGAVGTLADIKHEIEAIVAAKMEKIILRMNLVRREEFEVVRQLAENARSEQVKLTAKIAELEEKLK
ncbi:MAG: accessory factor UbiK family protein [Pseudomonadota bacterium]